MKEGFLPCHDFGAITHKKRRRRWKLLFIPPLKRRSKISILFKSVYFAPFVIGFNKNFIPCVCMEARSAQSHDKINCTTSQF